jgi:tRNA A-37 threonylcarbamoyl transferase component Bud32/tetratricopeptide (TPR) repeat protein
LGDRYLVERELGEGGAATVYLARDIRHERPVAIKVLRPDLGETLGPDRFTREIRTAANLQHPHILTVHDSGAADGLLFYVMPFVEGESLRARLQREGTGLPIADVIRILHDVADALAFAHQRGVVHRDIKPDNVLLSGKHSLVADFGVAKAISEATGRQNLTTMGVALGTPAYMAPEQAAADPHLDHRVDIYALGVMGYELLVGEPPFVRRNMQAVIAAHMTEPAPRVTARRPATPPALDALIAKCLEKQAGDRWQSAEEIVAELERLATPTGTAPMTAATIPATAARRTRPSRTLVVAALAVLVLAIGGWFAFRRPRSAAKLDQNTVAVLPFEFNAPPELAYLREGIVNVLESSLTGEGGPRAVASQTTIARWKRAGGGERGLTEEEARVIARDLGAGELLRGSIVGTPANLILSATLVSSSGDGRDVNANVSGPADSVATLAARLAAQLLSLRVGESSERLSSLASVPPTALRAYLVGQSAFRAGQYTEARRSFERALAIDSTFALAAFAHAVATSWDAAALGSSPGAEIAFRHRDRLSARDRILLEMWTPARFAGRALTGRETIALKERLAQQIPDRPEAWYLVGDAYFHFGPAYGFSIGESRVRAENALRRALALDPGITYVRNHIAELLLFAQDEWPRIPALADSLGLSAPHYKLISAVIRGDSAAIKRFYGEVGSLDNNELLTSAFFSVLVGAPSVGDSLFKVAIERPTDMGARQSALQWARSFDWREGRPKAAARLNDRLEELNETKASDLEPVYAAIFSDGDSVQANQSVARFALQLHDARVSSPVGRRTATWAQGLWASYIADSAGVSRAVRSLDSLGAQRDTTGEPELARLSADVLRLALPNRTPDRGVVDRADAFLHDGPSIGGEARAAMNLIVARSFERLGESKRAALAATRISVGEVIFVTTSPALRDQGRLWLAAGDTTAAINAWRIYLAWRTTAEPPQRKADDEIRRKLDEIQRARR